MSLKSFFSLSRMCFDVLSIKRQRHRKRREWVSQIYCTGVLAAATGRGGGKKLERRREGEGTDDTVYPTEGETET